jgi:hypothetical protein
VAIGTTSPFADHLVGLVRRSELSPLDETGRDVRHLIGDVGADLQLGQREILGSLVVEDVELTAHEID